MNNAKFDLSTLLPIRHNQPQTNKKQLTTTLSTANSSTPSTANTKKIGNYLLGTSFIKNRQANRLRNVWKGSFSPSYSNKREGRSQDNR